MIITTEQTKAGRIGIFADGDYMFSAAPDYWYSLGIYEGDDIDAAELEKIGRDIRIAKCCSAAYAYLARRAHSEKELRSKLLKKYTVEETDIAIEKAKELGILDEADYAESYADELLRNKHYAPQRIYAELLKHGTDRETAKIAADALEFDPEEQLQYLLETKFSTEKNSKKIIASLVRMGYSYSDIRRALEKYTDDEVLFDE